MHTTCYCWIVGGPDKKFAQIVKKHSFVIALLGLTIFLLAVVYAVRQFYPAIIYDYTIYFLIYFFFLSLLNHQFIRFALKNKGGEFTSFYFVSMLIRFFLSIIIIFVVIYVDRENRITAAISFMILYFAYLAFEIIWLLKKININSKE